MTNRSRPPVACGPLVIFETGVSMKRRLLLGAGTGLLASPGLLLAQAAYPNKPIRYIVPVAPGGGSDMVGRTVTERWGKLLNQTFLVDNQAGGGGVIACQVTAKAAPDGYTLLQGYDIRQSRCGSGTPSVFCHSRGSKNISIDWIIAANDSIAKRINNISINRNFHRIPPITNLGIHIQINPTFQFRYD